VTRARKCCARRERRQAPRSRAPRAHTPPAASPVRRAPTPGARAHREDRGRPQALRARTPSIPSRREAPPLRARRGTRRSTSRTATSRHSALRRKAAIAWRPRTRRRHAVVFGGSRNAFAQPHSQDRARIRFGSNADVLICKGDGSDAMSPRVATCGQVRRSIRLRGANESLTASIGARPMTPPTTRRGHRRARKPFVPLHLAAAPSHTRAPARTCAPRDFGL
jgi:hypothetical protein